MIGRTISHYKILEKLGEGGMGVVYKAEDTKLQRTVALKFLPQDLSRDEELKGRFIHEAQAASALDHNNICTIYEIDETDDGQMFIAMACYDGETLKKKIEQGPLRVEEAIDIAIQAGRGLDKAHQKQIVHRDIKPANVMVTDDSVVKVLDFGLAKLVGRTMLTKEGTTLGTMAYMSPEQTTGTEVDHRTDIWSLGALLYEMLTGQHPFKGDYEQAVAYSIMNEEPEPITGLRTGVPMELERIVNKCLKKEPVERYQHVDELITDLNSLRKGLESDTTGGQPSRQDARAGSIFKRKPVLIGTLAGLAVLAVIALLFLVPSKSPSVNDKSIAVLPFENLNKTEDSDYFSDGMTEDIRTQLSKISDMRVISSVAMRQYKESDKSPREIGSELNVATLLTGSVRRAGDRLRIGCELIDAVTQTQIWAQSYDREMLDVFAIQSEVAQQIAAVLKAKLSPGEKAEIERQPTANLTAYDYYLKGLEYIEVARWGGLKEKDLDQAIALLKKAIGLDPGYALAYANLGRAYILTNSRERTGAWLDSAIVVCEKAIALDSNCGWAYTHLGNVYYFRGQYTKALDTYGLHRDADPTMVYYVTGKLDKALQAAKRGVSRQPTSSFYYMMAGSLYRLLDHHVSAEEWFSKALELNQDDQTLFFSAELYLAQGRDEQAKQQMEKIIANPGENPSALNRAAIIARYLGDFSLAKELYEKAGSTSVDAGFSLWKTGQHEEAEKIFKQRLTSIPKMIEKGNEGYLLRKRMAALHAIQGDKAEAYYWLQEAIDAGWLDHRLALRDPLFEDLHGEVRFQEMLAQVKAKVDSMRKRVEELEE